MLRLILTVTLKFNIMEPIIKETKVIHDDGYNGRGGGNVRGRADAGLALGIVGTVLGGAALLGRGGLSGLLGGNMGQREHWPMNQMQQGFPQQGMYPQQGFQQSYPQQDMMQQMNPLWFL